MEIEDKLLFFKYALPCAGNSVARGLVTQQEVDRLIDMVSKGEVPDENAEKIFKVAKGICGYTAKMMGKDVIDSEVIREYFLVEHDKVVDDMFALVGDFNPVACKTRTGKIVEVRESTAIVETNLGKEEYRTDFAKNIKKNDKVIVHSGFVVEKASSDVMRKMNRQKVAR